MLKQEVFYNTVIVVHTRERERERERERGYKALILMFGLGSIFRHFPLFTYYNYSSNIRRLDYFERIDQWRKHQEREGRRVS